MEFEESAIHEWFGLTYASYLTLPRSLLEAMPSEWQARFVALLNEMEVVFEWPKDGYYEVQLKDAEGRYIKDPLRAYRHPDMEAINAARVGVL